MLVVYGSGTGKLPPAVLKHIPHYLLDDAEFLSHRLPVNEFPLAEPSRRWIDRYEEHILDRYAKDASLVLTPLLHVATPCLAMGVPVVVVRTNSDTRFGYIEQFTRIYTPESVSQINWNAEICDIHVAADYFIDELRRQINGLSCDGLRQPVELAFKRLGGEEN